MKCSSHITLVFVFQIPLQGQELVFLLLLYTRLYNVDSKQRSATYNSLPAPHPMQILHLSFLNSTCSYREPAARSGKVSVKGIRLRTQKKACSIYYT